MLILKIETFLNSVWPLVAGAAVLTAEVALSAVFIFAVTGTIFSQRLIFPKTLRNSGWLMQVVNHLVTLVKTFLSDDSKTYKTDVRQSNNWTVYHWSVSGLHKFQTVYEAKTPRRTYLKGRRTAIATAMSASVMLSPTKKVLGSSAWSRTFSTRITSALEFCWIWEHTKSRIKLNTQE